MVPPVLGRLKAVSIGTITTVMALWRALTILSSSCASAVGPEVGFSKPGLPVRTRQLHNDTTQGPPSIEKNWSSTRQLWSFQRRARDTGDSSYPSFPKIQPSLQVFLPLYSQTHIFGAYHISPKAVLPSREVQRGTGCGSSFGSSRIRFSNDASGPRHGAWTWQKPKLSI